MRRRKNSWGLAEYAGLATPQAFEHLLNGARWSADELRDQIRGYVLAGLADPGGALVLDDTQAIKKGVKSVGVAPQHCGATGQTENCQCMVMLSYASVHGHAFVDRELYLPACWTTLRVLRTSSILVAAILITDSETAGSGANPCGRIATVVYAECCARMACVLMRLAYLGVTNALALLRMLPMSDRDKDAEILALRHQIMVLERQLHGDRVQFTPTDRAWLAALLHPLPRTVLNHLRLLVRPETVVRWHRDLIARRHARRSRPHQGGRPPTIRSIRRLVLRLARENSTWGYRRIHGELLVVGVKVAASTVWEILHEAGVDPAPERTSSTWAAFLGSQAHAVIAADFFETTTLTGAKLYVLAVIEHATRRVRILSVTAHPTTAWVTQAAHNLVIDLDDAGCQVRYLIRDRDGKYPALFDSVLADTGIDVVLSGVRIPRMNSIMERRIQACRHELLDRTLIWNQAHLLHALREYEHHHNRHRPHRGIANARPQRPLPEPITEPTPLKHLNVRRHDRLGGLLHEYQNAA